MPAVQVTGFALLLTKWLGAIKAAISLQTPHEHNVKGA